MTESFLSLLPSLFFPALLGALIVAVVGGKKARARQRSEMNEMNGLIRELRDRVVSSASASPPHAPSSTSPASYRRGAKLEMDLAPDPPEPPEPFKLKKEHREIAVGTLTMIGVAIIPILWVSSVWMAFDGEWRNVQLLLTITLPIVSAAIGISARLLWRDRRGY